jgi:amino-acid N-acetyltransferase
MTAQEVQLSSQQAMRIIAKFGNARRLAEALGCEASAVYRWTYPPSRGGTDGYVPTRAIQKVKDAAVLLGIDLTPEDWAA